MRIAARALVAVSAACLAVPLVPTAAVSAEQLTESAGTGAYFWKGKQPSTFTIGSQTQPNPANNQDTDLDGVARDELAVAVQTRGSTDKEFFLAWDLVDLSSDDTITRFVVTSPVSETPPSSDLTKNTVQFGTQGVQLQACAPKGGFGSTDAGAYEVKPEVDLTKCVPGQVDATGKLWTFDVTTLASTWLTTQNNGIAIVPTAAQLEKPFQLVFKPASAHAATIEYTPGDDELGSDFDTDLGGDVVVESDTSFLSDSTGFDDGSFSSGSSGSASIDPLLASVTGGETTDPAVAAETPTEVRSSPVAAALPAPSGVPAGFWLAALALGGALLLMSRTTGGQPVPVAPARRQGSVLKQVVRMQGGSS